MPLDWDIDPGASCENGARCVDPSWTWDDAQLVGGICPLCRRIYEDVPSDDGPTGSEEPPFIPPEDGKRD
jgi:hypothetical protein